MKTLWQRFLNWLAPDHEWDNHDDYDPYGCCGGGAQEEWR